MSGPAHTRRGTRLSAAALAAACLVSGAAPAGAHPSAAAPPDAYQVKGVDTSHHNHDTTGRAIDRERVARHNASAVLKAAQGAAYEDPWFAREAASATSLLRAPYHFFGPKSTRDGAARAGHFVRTARRRLRGDEGRGAAAGPGRGGRPGRRQGGPPRDLRADQLRIFPQRVKSAFEMTPVVSTRASLVTACTGGEGEVFRGHPLWPARYRGGAEEPQNVPGAGAWTFWQYTETERVPGIPGRDGAAGTADRDVYRGPLAGLRAPAHLGGAPRPAPCRPSGRAGT
ncbi:glycoside hydrolase family 25 protein, partial [Streptomyces leeuwenhoekii]